MRLLQAVVLGLMSLASPGLAQPPLPWQVAPPPDPELIALEKKLGIRIVIHEPPVSYFWRHVSFNPLTQDDLESLPYRHYRRLFLAEFAKYPPALSKLADLRQVALVRDLAISYQLRAALPDYRREVLYLDVYSGIHKEIYQRHVVHHEFYHLLEEEVFGSVYYKDPAWARLNPPDFSYGKGGYWAQSGPQYDLVHPHPGFVNRYAGSGLEEDKAEIFAVLMMPEESRLVHGWSRTDPVLASKLAAMKAFLRQRVPEMDESWWQKLEKQSAQGLPAAK